MSKIKNGGLDQYGAGPFEQQQFGTVGVERVKIIQSAHFNSDFLAFPLQLPLGILRSGTYALSHTLDATERPNTIGPPYSIHLAADKQ